MLRLIVICLTLWFAGNASAQLINWPSAVLPSGIFTQGVGDVLVVNGVSTKILQFSIPYSAQQFQRAFKERDSATWSWKSLGNGIFRASRKEGAFLLNIELRERGDSTSGRWSASHLFTPQKISTSELPSVLPYGMKMLHSVESVEFDQRSQLYVAASEETMENTVVHVENALFRDGFRQVIEIQNPWQASDRYFNIYRGDRQEYQISVTRNKNRTVLVLNRLSAMERVP